MYLTEDKDFKMGFGSSREHCRYFLKIALLANSISVYTLLFSMPTNRIIYQL